MLMPGMRVTDADNIRASLNNETLSLATASCVGNLESKISEIPHLGLALVCHSVAYVYKIG